MASNMCHKFPKALVGAWRRSKLGHVDLKLGVFMGVSAVLGVEVGIYVQEIIARAIGPAGTSLYVSGAFVVVLPVVSYFLIRDVIEARKGGLEDTTSELAVKAQRIHLRPMLSFKVAGSTISAWLVIPMAFATGFLAATIAVGGFIGVPSMMYVVGAPGFIASASELVVAFIMGATGTFRWGLDGMVDIRMTLLILCGSLIGVQIGAIGTSYVKEYTVKLVMATVMLLVVVSRAIAVPIYVDDLGWISLNGWVISVLDDASFAILAVGIVSAGALVLTPMVQKRLALRREGRLTECTETSPPRRELLPSLVIFAALSLIAYILLFMNQDWATDWLTTGTAMTAITIIAIAMCFSLIHGAFAHRVLKWLKIGALLK